MVPKISIIVPVYKAEAYLHRCVDSILLQSFQDFEVLLIDDGSPDKSGEICDEYAKKDSRVRVFHKENGGVSSVRNLGLDKAVGEWISFVDSDDYLKLNALDVAMCHINKLRDANIDMLQFSYSRVTIDGNIVLEDAQKTELLDSISYIKENKCIYAVWCNLIKKSIIENYRIRFVDDVKLAEDQLFIMECMYRSKNIIRIPDLLYMYSDIPNSASNASKDADILYSCKVLLNYRAKRNVYEFHINEVFFYFLIYLLKNNSTDINILKELYVSYNINIDSKMSFVNKLFYYMAKCNFSIACIVFRILFMAKNKLM